MCDAQQRIGLKKPTNRKQLNFEKGPLELLQRFPTISGMFTGSSLVAEGDEAYDIDLDDKQLFRNRREVHGAAALKRDPKHVVHFGEKCFDVSLLARHYHPAVRFDSAALDRHECVVLSRFLWQSLGLKGLLDRFALRWMDAVAEEVSVEDQRLMAVAMREFRALKRQDVALSMRSFYDNYHSNGDATEAETDSLDDDVVESEAWCTAAFAQTPRPRIPQPTAFDADSEVNTAVWRLARQVVVVPKSLLYGEVLHGNAGLLPVHTGARVSSLSSPRAMPVDQFEFSQLIGSFIIYPFNLFVHTNLLKNRSFETILILKSSNSLCF
mgnify:CR=1 FL=1